MKYFLRVMVTLSILVIVLSIFKLWDTYTSLKYEVEEPLVMSKNSGEIGVKSQWLHTLIFWLWLLLGYAVAVAILCIKLANNHKNKSINN